MSRIEPALECSRLYRWCWRHTTATFDSHRYAFDCLPWTQLNLIIAAGQTTQCVSTPAEPSPSFTVTANVTGTLETCQPWGITVSGGVPPYTITLAQTNQPVVTNVTMDFGANRFTFPNRALPGGSLIGECSYQNNSRCGDELFLMFVFIDEFHYPFLAAISDL